MSELREMRCERLVIRMYGSSFILSYYSSSGVRVRQSVDTTTNSELLVSHLSAVVG